MFLSNTATAAMMLTFLTPVLKALPADGKGKIGLAMAIPVAANVGGMGTPIGTPPNAIALKYLNDPEGLNLNIGFGEWMSFMLPYTIIVLFIAWFILLRLFPFKQKSIELQIGSRRLRIGRSLARDRTGKAYDRSHPIQHMAPCTDDCRFRTDLLCYGQLYFTHSHCSIPM